MSYQPVGADEENNLPPAVVEKLGETFAHLQIQAPNYPTVDLPPDPADGRIAFDSDNDYLVVGVDGDWAPVCEVDLEMVEATIEDYMTENPPPVTQVAGLTGDVSAEALAGELDEYFGSAGDVAELEELVTEGRLSEDELSATYALKDEVPTGAVTSPMVLRVLVSNDPDTPLLSGDLLFVYEERSPVFTQFAGGLDEVTEPWAAGSWSAESGVSGATGLVLRKPSGLSPATGRRALRVTAAGEAADVEAVMRVRSDTAAASQIHTALVLRGSGAQTTEDGIYVALHPANGIYVAELRAGSSVLLGYVTSFSWSVDTWYWLRARVIGTSIQVKAWEDGDTEPGSWSGSFTATITSAGWLGFMASASGEQDFDLYGAGFDGATAPKVAP